MDPYTHHTAQHELVLLILRGVAAILFGIIALFWPGLTTLGLVYLFSAFVVATGLMNLIDGLVQAYGKRRSTLTRLAIVLIGLAEIGIGVFLIRNTDISLRVFIALIALALIIRGALEIAASFLERRHYIHRIFVAIAGVLAIAVGVLLLLQPEPTSVAFVWVVGLYALISGPILIAIALAVRHELNRPVYSRPLEASPKSAKDTSDHPKNR